MSQRIKAKTAKRRRGFTYLWIFGLAVLVFVLIYFEQTALLYILATLGVTALLIVVAVADLGRSDRTSEASAQLSDAQARGAGISSRVPAGTPKEKSRT
ncbi:MAG TPA: hypothetical protein VHD88_02755 [Pyrinomonadaceae bacterium]|nr:hypothetical protein [Pyrinomonadaceae bacterium]